MNFKKSELNFIKGTVKFEEPMSRHTSFKIGGPADVFIVPRDEEDLLNVLRYARNNTTDVFILGGGSNILVGDKGIRGFVVSLNAPAFKRLDFDGRYAHIGAGALTSRFIAATAAHGLGGCEFLAGIPGTIGGAIMMNAGRTSCAIGDLLEEVTVLDGLKEVKLKREDLNPSYRDSGLEGLVLISACLKLKGKSKAEAEAGIKENLKKKRRTQDLEFPSAGCVFKNPSEDISAGRLIDLSGFKGYSAGRAMVSEKHANFIINRRDATASQVRRLIDEIQKKVFKDYRIMLKLEVKFIGEF